MPATNKTRVAFSVTNCICFDQRVLKIAETVSQLDCSITIIGRELDNCPHDITVPFNTKRFRMFFKRGFLFYKFFNIRLFFYLLFHKFDLLVANDLDTLPANFIVSKLKNLPLVFDAHEYFTGVPELNGRTFVKWVWKSIERIIFPHLQYTMTVSDSIAVQYVKEYAIKPVVVRNCSKTSSDILAISRYDLGINKDDILLVFQGGGINIDKGGEELIEAIRITENVSLIIIGSGDVLPSLKKMVYDLNLSGRIKFFPKMPWSEMMRYTKSADAGLCLEKDTNLNYRYSLPNKLFDYISAGIPVIATGLPEIKKVVGGYNCGIVIQEIKPEEISAAIKRLAGNRELLNTLKQNAIRASGTLNWEYESKKVINFYKEVLKWD